METNSVIGAMIKGRECCRQVVRAYEQTRDARYATNPDVRPDVNSLKRVDNAASRLLGHLKNLPENPQSRVTRDSDKKYATQLLGEIGQLLEKAIIMEREMRQAIRPGNSHTMEAGNWARGRAAQATMGDGHAAGRLLMQA